jgi:hypothetical protein
VVVGAEVFGNIGFALDQIAAFKDLKNFLKPLIDSIFRKASHKKIKKVLKMFAFKNILFLNLPLLNSTGHKNVQRESRRYK